MSLHKAFDSLVMGESIMSYLYFRAMNWINERREWPGVSGVCVDHRPDRNLVDHRPDPSKEPDFGSLFEYRE